VTLKNNLRLHRWCHIQRTLSVEYHTHYLLKKVKYFPPPPTPKHAHTAVRSPGVFLHWIMGLGCRRESLTSFVWLNNSRNFLASRWYEWEKTAAPRALDQIIHAPVPSESLDQHPNWRNGANISHSAPAFLQTCVRTLFAHIDSIFQPCGGSEIQKKQSACQWNWELSFFKTNAQFICTEVY
jgi:hypothetical protein